MFQSDQMGGGLSSNAITALTLAFAVEISREWDETYSSAVLTWHFTEEEPRRPGQRLPTAMLGNEVMTKEQLFDLFQQILNVKKFEHQLLYNAMQVTFISSTGLLWASINLIYFQLDSADEQAAAIRRELDARREKISEMERVRE